MKKCLSILCLMFFITGCGDDNPTNFGQPIANKTFSLPGGSFVEFPFSVDTDVQQNVFLQGEFTVEGGSVQMAVMNESDFITLQESGTTPRVLYSPGNTPRDSFRLPIDESAVYYVVFSNLGSDAVTIKSEIFLISTTDQGELEE